jgi:hypothetical protein
MHAVNAAATDGIDIFPVVVVTRAFRARPSSVPDIRDFVRQQLTRSALAEDDVRALCRRVADVLLEAAGAGGEIHVSLRIFTGHAEIDVLQTTRREAIGSTGAVVASPPHAGGSSRSELMPAATAGSCTAPPGVTFPEWLAEALLREEMTMEAASRRLGVSVKTVSRWVRGATEPRLHDLSRIREVFGDIPFP